MLPPHDELVRLQRCDPKARVAVDLAAFIIEEGTETVLLRRIVAPMADEATRAGVRIVTGDTKVVGRGSADKVFITTSGIAVIPPVHEPEAVLVRPGDVANRQ